MLIGERIKKERINKGLTQAELGAMLGVSKVSVCGLPRNNTENTALIFGEENQFCMVYFNLNKM